MKSRGRRLVVGPIDIPSVRSDHRNRWKSMKTIDFDEIHGFLSIRHDDQQGCTTPGCRQIDSTAETCFSEVFQKV